ncbi:MAG: group II intron reverse transcriptase/maturase [Nitrospira sp.]|nr:group II intron reverse transcriptase/maturase [Nitrospira sp.]
MGTYGHSPLTDKGYPRRPGTKVHGGGVSVVVRGRESRPQGEGGQVSDTRLKPEERSVDSDLHTDTVWLLGVQRKLYQWSQDHPGEAYRELWNWITDIRSLRCAWDRVARNKGQRTPGIDGRTVGSIRQQQGEGAYLGELHRALRSGTYWPSPCRRKLIPKPGKPGQFRPLGIPTVTDRVVQAAIKQFLEPILEARFWHVSYGFRPGRGCHGALEPIRMATRPRKTSTVDGKRHDTPYQWVVEGDIQGCFDHIDHHLLMNRVRQHCADRRVNRWLVQFLKAGALSEEQFLRTDAGTPQGGIISPLLANIALSVIEERYERWVNHQTKRRAQRSCDGITAAMEARSSDRRAGRPVYFPVRYADDFIVLVSGAAEDAAAERAALATLLQQRMGLTLSPGKTRITPLTEGFEFLGHRVRMRWDTRYGWTPRIEVPKEKVADLRYKVKQLTGRATTPLPLIELLQKLNPILRGWANFYRHCTGAKDILSNLDWYVGDRLWRWMRKKYPKAHVRTLLRHRRPSRIRRTRRVWQEDGCEQFQMSLLKVERYKRGWMQHPDFTKFAGEPDA